MGYRVNYIPASTLESSPSFSSSDERRAFLIETLSSSIMEMSVPRKQKGRRGG